MVDDLCVRCGQPAEGFTVYLGWRLCHSTRFPSCYDVAAGILRTARFLDPTVNVPALQQRLAEDWALLQERRGPAIEMMRRNAPYLYPFEPYAPVSEEELADLSCIQEKP